MLALLRLRGGVTPTATRTTGMTPDQQTLDQLAWTAVPRRLGAGPSHAEAGGALPFVTHMARVWLDDVTSLRCYQLSTGERFFDQDDVHSLFFPDPDPQALGLASTPVPAQPGNY